MKDKDIDLSDPLASMALFAEMNPQPVIRFNREAKILQCNQAAHDLFNKDTLENDSITNILPGYKEYDLQSIIDEDRIVTLQTTMHNRHYSFVCRGISRYKVAQVYGFDITEKVKAQREAESMALFAQKNPAPVFRFNQEGRLLLANEAAEELFDKVCTKEVNIYNFFPHLQENEVADLIRNNKIQSFVENYNS